MGQDLFGQTSFGREEVKRDGSGEIKPEIVENEKPQGSLFSKEEVPEKWEKEWQDMPEFKMEDKTSYKQIIVHFACQKDRDDFATLIDQKITYKTQSLWFPKAEIERLMNKRYIDES